MHIVISALNSDDVRKLRAGGLDSNGQIPERVRSDGDGNPCRHCLGEIPKDAEMLILGYRPFPSPQPYAEVGPIFLCAENCHHYSEKDAIPERYQTRSMLLRGYDSNDRIVYGTGAIAKEGDLVGESRRLLGLPQVEYLHARSPTNNCFHFRIDSG